MWIELNRLKIFSAILSLGLALLCPLQTAALDLPSPPSGFRIDNVAEGFYLVEGNINDVIEFPSNTASIFVGPLYRLHLTESQQINSVAAQTVSFQHNLINMGNTADSFTLDLVNLGGDSADLQNLALYLDANSNGEVDSGETAITQTPELESGEILSLVITGQVPATVAAADTLEIRLIATSDQDATKFQTNTDRIIVIQGALLRITKTSSQACSIPVFAGDLLTYDVEWTNSGDQLPLERNHSIDGAPQTGVMIEDRLPADINLIAGQTINFVPFAGKVVVMLKTGVAQKQWISYENWNQTSKLARIGLLVPASELRPNQSGMFSINVRVSPNVTLNSTIFNQVVVDEDGDGSFEFASARVCNTTGGPKAAIRFLSPSFENIRNQVAPSFTSNTDFSDTLRYRFDSGSAAYNATFDGVYVELDSTSIPDDNLQFLEDGTRQAVVNITSALSGQTIPVLVRETDLGTGNFRSALPVVLSRVESGDGNLCGDLFSDVDYTQVPPSQCSLLSGQNDKLTVSFYDGGLGEVIDDASIVDPLGFVFDAVTLEPIQGVEVRVFNAVDNGPAGLQDTLAVDPFSPTSAPLVIQVTDATGFYQYPFMFAGKYYMTLTMPAGINYSWPSRRDPNIFPGTDVSEFSYGRNGFSGIIDSGVFTLDEENPIIAVDFPVDPVELQLEVNGSVSCDADLASEDPVSYNVTFANSGNLIPPERNITIDGLPQSGVVVRTQVPLNTVLDAAVIPTFSPASAQLMLKLYDSTDVDTWVSYASWIAQPVASRLPVKAVAVLVPASDLEPSTAVGVLGEGGTLSFGVRIVNGVSAGTQISTRVTVDLDGDSVAEILGERDFDEVCESVTGPEPYIRFTQPNNAGAVPQHEVDSHWVDTSYYLLDGYNPDYQLTEDSVYLELYSTSIRSEDFILLPDGRRETTVGIESVQTGDTVQELLRETGYATGLYRSLIPLNLHFSNTGNEALCQAAGGGADYSADPGPACILTSTPNDTLQASFIHRYQLNDGGTTPPEVVLADTAFVQPLGFVFLSNAPYEPVAGAIVRFFRVTGPGTADVVGDPLVSATDGSFTFPNLVDGDYYIEVEDTDDFSFASIVSQANLQANSGYNLSAYSYGQNGGAGVFTISAANPVQTFDVPVDFVGGNAALVVTKTSNQSRVEIGGLLEYSVNVSNVGDSPAQQVKIEDRLPFGFKYIENTLRQEDALIADPVGSPAPILTFDVGILGAGESTEFKYVLQATSGAIDSDGVNIAQASGTDASAALLVSNEARVKVAIDLSGVLSEKGIIFGKIFVDADCNNIQSQGEWPVGGVALYLEDGTYAITDENGQYSMYGINPGSHSLKLDPLTLPEGLRLKPIDNRNLAQPGSRLVDLQNGEFHRADFAAACPLPEEADFVYAQVAERNMSIQGDWLTANSASFDQFERAAAQAALTSDDLSSGRLLSAGQLGSSDPLSSPVTGALRNDIDLTSATTAEEVASAIVVEEVIYEITEEQAMEGLWLWPQDNISLYGRFVVAVRDRVEANLYINGELVTRDQLGEESHNPVTDAQVLAWYGVRLRDGENLVEVKTQDMFGNDRVMLSKTFVSPSQAVRLVLESDKDVLPADGGRSTLPIRISVLDAAGNYARGLHFVTLESTDGRILAEDIQPDTPGIQLRLDRGTKEIELQSSNRTGEVELRAFNDEFDESKKLSFVAAQRSLLVSGVASASAGTCSLDSDGYAPTLDECTDGLMSDRAALFMKGSVRGNLFLTLSYDSDKVGDAELLRDINPDEYYPIFGDSSVRGYEAQSRSKLYAKLEMDRSYIQWGDFATDRNTDFQNLARVQRTLTGFSAVVEEDKLKAEIFAAEVDDTRESVEIPGNGTAMLFRIQAAPIVRNSEVIELITRDRENNGLILSSVNLVRNIDYSLDHITGDIRFTRTIPSIDSDLNPLVLRISYDLENGGSSDLVAGARMSYEVTEQVQVGGSYTIDENATNGYELAGAFVEYKTSDKSRVFISSANMDHKDAAKDSGNALYAELEMTWDNGSKSSMRWGRAEAGFTNSGSGVSADREELSAQHVQQLSKSLSMDVDLVRSKSLSTIDSRESIEVGIDYSLAEWTLSLGGRRIDQQTATNPQDQANTIIAGAGRSFVLFGRKGNLNTEFEREVGQQDRKRWLVGGSYQLHDNLSAYANFEQINSLTGASALRSGEEQITASLGFESDFLPSTSIFNEYRMRGVSDGRDLEAATGINGDYEIFDGLTINPSIEWIDVLEGDSDKDAFAVSLGIEDLRNANARRLARIESRFEQGRDYYGLDLSYVARVNLDWSSFVREELTYSAIEDSDNDMSHELTLGLTHRPRETNQYHALFMYQWREERGASLLDDRSLHLFSTHQNYQIDEDWVVSGRLGGKYESIPLLDEDFSSLTAVLDGKVIWDISRRFDLDVHAGLLATNSFEENRYSFGAGISFLVMEGLRLGLGYNLSGFEEGDLDTEGFNRQGWYVRAEYKFDEDLFHWLEPELYRDEEK